MDITVNDLLLLRLDPQEFMAACYILTQTDHDLAVVKTSAIAQVVGVTDRQARRLVARLIEAGVLTRVQRGIYRVQHPGKGTGESAEKDTVVPERTGESVSGSVYSHMAIDDMATKTPNGVLVERSAPVKGYKILRGSIMPISYDDGDDLGGFGLTEPRRSASKRSPSKPPKFHREVPRSDWNMRYVAKEFRHQLQPHAMRLRLIGGGGDDKLVKALMTWQGQYGVSVEDAATLVDDFFADPSETGRLCNEVDAWRQFLIYAKRNVDRLRDAVVDEDYLASLDAQEVPF